MAATFLDCTDDLLALWQSIHRPGDPEIAVNMSAGQPANVPKLLSGYSTCIVDHTYFDAELLGSCPDLRRIVFLGTGASSFIDLAAAAKHGIAVDTIRVMAIRRWPSTRSRSSWPAPATWPGWIATCAPAAGARCPACS